LEAGIRDGPIRIPGHDGSKIERLELLWEAIEAREFRPATDSEAFYELAVSTPVDGVPVAALAELEERLFDAMDLLVHCWIFAGGSYLPTVRKEVVVEAAYFSNLEDVRRTLLAREGRQWLSTARTLCGEVVGTYAAPPLRRAAEIARAIRARPRVRRMLRHHHTAWWAWQTSRGRDPGWYTELYKVRDALKNLHEGKAKRVRSALGISRSDWEAFGHALNPGRRHDPGDGQDVVELNRSAEHDLLQLTRSWIHSYLHHIVPPSA
jgi:hypothetical protein